MIVKLSQSKLLKYRVFFTNLVVVIDLIIAKPSFYFYFLGFFLVLIGVLLRIWASGCIHKNEFLIKEGPYNLCRNPLYLGSFLSVTGFSFIASRWESLILLIFLFLIFYVPTIYKEEDYLKTNFKENFSIYCREVPRFFPTIKSFIKNLNFKNNSYNFSWAQVKKNREPLTFTAMLVGALLGILKLFS